MTTLQTSKNSRQKKYYDKHKDDEDFKLKNRLRVKEYVDAHKDDPMYKERRKNIVRKYDNKPETKLRLQKYYNDDKAKFQTRSKLRSREIRLEVIDYYSNGEMKCKECGENNIEFLEIDHIDGGGNKHKKEEKYTNLYHYLKRNNFPDGYQILCSSCNSKKVKLAAREKGMYGTSNQRYRYTYTQKIKNDAFSHYSINGEIKCSCPNCNEKDIDKLCLDHINGDGDKHRKELRLIGVVGAHLYHWIKKNNYPQIFRILCHNCNQSLGNYGYCPHDNN